jgi:hypothetical protein
MSIVTAPLGAFGGFGGRFKGVLAALATSIALLAPGLASAAGTVSFTTPVDGAPARVLERLSWDHSAPHLLAAYDRVFAKPGRR